MGPRCGPDPQTVKNQLAVMLRKLLEPATAAPADAAAVRSASVAWSLALRDRAPFPRPDARITAVWGCLPGRDDLYGADWVLRQYVRLLLLPQ